MIEGRGLIGERRNLWGGTAMDIESRIHRSEAESTVEKGERRKKRGERGISICKKKQWRVRREERRPGGKIMFNR